MIVLLTDFGIRDPYIGQMKAVIYRDAPDIPVINLFPELPPFAIKESAYLLPAYQEVFPDDTVFLCVVDPGVGTNRVPVILRANNRWFVGPDNGLFDIVKKRFPLSEQWCLEDQPQNCSTTFHGRDIFAPAAAILANGNMPRLAKMPAEQLHQDWPDDLQRIVYCDHYGNAMTGIRSSQVSEEDRFRIGGRELCYQRTFAEAGTAPFWYCNSNGLVEFALNQGNVTDTLQLKVGDELTWIRPA